MPMGNDHIRSFIAVSLPVPIKKKLGAIQNRIRIRQGQKAGFPRWENLHITLIFLGNMHAKVIEGLPYSMDTILQQIPGFSLSLSKIGTFPGRNRPARVLWAGLDGDVHILKQIHHDLITGLISSGLTFDRQKFSPHITLARFKTNLGYHQFSDLVSPKDFSGETFQVQGIDLYKSKLTPRGAIYTLLHTSPLQPANG